ncbi:MAG: hypothetical protein ED559_10420 [Phycisphaera sp.]|nr:MAG: hypothetical protein ED559_10420 [Phycisphaera sp.]
MKHVLPLIAIALTATGCAVEDNYRLNVNDSVTLQSLPPAVADERSGLIGSADHNDIPGDGPSITGLDRSNFEASKFSVPVDRTYHHPHYTHPIAVLEDHARQRGEFPKYTTVFEQDDPSMLEQSYEYAAVSVWSVVELAWMAPSLVISPPWATTHSPSEEWERASQTTTMLVPGVVTLTQAEIEDLEAAKAIEEGETVE